MSRSIHHSFQLGVVPSLFKFYSVLTLLILSFIVYQEFKLLVSVSLRLVYSYLALSLFHLCSDLYISSLFCRHSHFQASLHTSVFPSSHKLQTTSHWQSTLQQDTEASLLGYTTPSQTHTTTTKHPFGRTVIMCFQILELYSACRCLYYQHAVDRCAAYGRPGHGIQRRTILVGYACSEHSRSSSYGGSYDYSSSQYPDSGYHSSSRSSKSSRGSYR